MLESVLASVLNRFLSSYVDGLNTSQLNVGIWSGDVKLRNLRLKTSALDKFRLPINVTEGYLGDLTLSIPWSNLKNKPVRVLIENVYLLASPKSKSDEVDEEEEIERELAVKLEKLASNELLGRESNAGGMSAEEAKKSESFTSSLVTKIVDNLQITVKNIHIRYEDKLSNPEHPFSAGLTLAEFSAVSTDGEWNPTFIQNSQDGIHKLARLESLAVYWDTDSYSLAGHDISTAQQKFNELISRENNQPSHQFILKPVSGAGRLVMRRQMSSSIPKMDAQLLFEELGFSLDDEQYRDVISVTDLFHFYNRQAQYRKFRPSKEEMEENKPKSLLKFATKAILNEVHEKHKVWSWEFFKERRDDRKEYVSLFKEKEKQNKNQNQNQQSVNPTGSNEGERLRELERKLDYKDIRFYRSIARQELKKQRLEKRKQEIENGTYNPGEKNSSSNGNAAAGGGWLGWIWGGGNGSNNQSSTDPNGNGVLSEEQRKELYDAIEWDEDSSTKTSQSLTTDFPLDFMKLRLTTKLKTGSFALKDHNRGEDILALVFDDLQADVCQRIENLEASISLGGLRVYDGTTKDSIYPQVVRVKDEVLIQSNGHGSASGGAAPSAGTKQSSDISGLKEESDPSNPFFYLCFEHKPLDERADNALTLRMRSMEIIYHRGYVESIVKFFKPPESELELIGALIDVASETIEGIRNQTRAGLENALENHKTIDMVVDVKAPIIIVPEDVKFKKCQHIVLDAGHIAIRSVLADQSKVETVRSRLNKTKYTREDYKDLEDLMYDRFFVELQNAQLVMAGDLQSCMDGLDSSENPLKIQDSTSSSSNRRSETKSSSNSSSTQTSSSSFSTNSQRVHLLERINLDFTLHNSILPKAPNLTKFKITGHLPELRVNFSDRKYKTLMTIIDVAIPRFEDDDPSSSATAVPTNKSAFKDSDSVKTEKAENYQGKNNIDVLEPSKITQISTDGGNENEKTETEKQSRSSSISASPALDLSKERRARLAEKLRRGDQNDYVIKDDDDDDEEEATKKEKEKENQEEDEDDDEADFQDAEDATADKINAHQKTFELEFVVDKLSGSIFKSNSDPSKPDRLLVEAIFEGFLLHLSVFPYHMEVDVGLRSLALEDKIVDHGNAFKYLITSKNIHNHDKHAKNLGNNNSSRFTTSDSQNLDSSQDLVSVKYTRVDPDSPEFMTKYEGVDQSINVELSTINIMLTRVSVLVVYDWIMTTFVPSDEEEGKPSEGKGEDQDEQSSENKKQVATIPESKPGARKEKLRVRVKLTSIVLRLNNDGQLLATLTLSTADVAVLLRGSTLRVAARLGSLLLVDNAVRDAADPEFKKLLSIQGDELADFTYETFDSADQATYPGYDVSIWLRSGSLRFTFLEEPVRDLLQFFSKFARMKALYDAASSAASAQASQLQDRVSRMQYDVIIKTPILVLTREATSSDIITANLGEIYAHNTFTENDSNHVVTKVEAGLRHIRLASRLRYGSQEYHVQMIDDVNISVDMTQSDHLGHENVGDQPDTQIVAKMSDVQINLTEQQYGFVMSLTQSIPRAFSPGEDEEEEAKKSMTLSTDSDTPELQRPSSPSTTAGSPLTERPSSDNNSSSTKINQPSVDMLPELGTVAHGEDGDVPLHTTLDLFFSVQAIKLEIFTSAATAQRSLRNASLAKFALNGSEVKFKMLSDSAMEAEVALKSFTVSDTRPDKVTQFREIVPAVKHEGHQFMLSYTMSGGTSDKSALALITVDSPKIIFSLDPLFALLNFFMSAFQEADSTLQDEEVKNKKQSEAKKNAPSSKKAAAPSTAAGGNRSISGGQKTLEGAGDTSAGDQGVENQPESTLAFRINIVDPTIILLAAPERSDSEAIILSIKQVLMSQQGILALKVDQIGMFMCKMSKPKDTLRFLDNLDLTLAMDSRVSAARQITSIEIDVEPLVLRVSYRDIMLISSVVNKAIELSNTVGATNEDARSIANSSTRREASAATSTSLESIHKTNNAHKDGQRSIRSASDGEYYGEAELIMAKEVLKAEIAGLQVILIGDAHSLPMLDLNIQKFNVNVHDWSGDMRMNTSLATYINYYNLSRSHWEPLIDPWSVDFSMAGSVSPPNTTMTISSKRRLELNVTTTLIETALTTAAIMNDESIQASQNRNNAPFKIRNRTGYRLSLWSEHEDQRIKSPPQHVEDGQDMPWRFDDWKSMRENAKESGGNMLSLLVEGMPWERVRHISVDREGEHLVNLRPKLEKVPHRLLCDVKLQDNVKIITFRSSFKVENRTLVPVEMVILDNDGQMTDDIRKIPPGEDCPVPIEAAYHNRIKLRPDPGFEYDWSTESVGWQELIRKSTRALTCKANDANEAPFRLQCFTIYDKQDPLSRVYPRLSLRLRAPVEVENLLPYDIHYRIFDKNVNHNWSSYLRKGGISPIHVVELSHLLLLSVDIQSSVFSPSEFAIIATDNPDDFPIEKTLTMADAENLKLNLRLHYFKYPESGGAFKVQIYSPYIFVNQSGLPFSLKTKSWMGGAKLVAGQESGAAAELRKEPHPFLFSHNSNDRRNRVQLRIGDSAWSSPLSFEAIGSETEVVIPSASKNEEIHVGLTVEDGLGKFKLSKVVKLTPRYLVRNNLDEPINLREAGAADFVTAEPRKRLPLHFLRVGASKQMTLAYPGMNNKWTAPFNIEDVGSVHLRIAKAGHHQHLVKAEVLLEGPTIFISLSYEKGPWPYMLRNESDYTITFMQAAERQSDDGRSSDAADEAIGKRYELKPRSKMKYAWDYPARSDKLIKLVANGRERSVNILEIGSLLPFKFPSSDGRGNRVISLDVRADGPTQTLVLSNYTESLSNFKLKRQNSTFSRTDSMSSTRTGDGGFEAVDIDTNILSAFNVELEGVGISLINRNVQELAYISFRGLEVHYTESEVTTALNLVVKWIQIDNQLFGGLFPIVFYPTVIPKDGKDLEVHPTLQASMIRLKDQTHGVAHIKYASILLQEVTAELDEDFLFALYDFSKLEGASWEAEATKETDFIEHPREVPEPKGAQGNQEDIYFEILHLQPIALNLSFMRTERVNADERVSSRNPLIFFFNALTMALGNVNDAPVRLNALVIENVRLSPAVLQQRIVYHYGQGFLFQLYRVLGSADFLGNPVGLFNNVSSGVADIFYEPYQGLVMHGNKELGLGIARGASSFVKKTVFGLTDSVSKVTGSIGKGLAAATMDKEFQSRRRMSRFRNKPKHALYGITAGANSFFTSVASGFEGLALRPLEGAEQGGAGGFFKGVGKGIVGVITKPAVGVFDLASNVTEGMRNTTVVFDQNDIDRVRLPRFIASDGIVRPYSDREALGQTWLKNVDNGSYMKEHYVAHVDVGGSSGGDSVVMLTVTKILFIKTLRLKVPWEVPLSDLSSISLESQGIALILRGGVDGPFLHLSDKGSRNWFFKQISRVVQAYNSSHA